jgi:hypothetical protein
VELKLFSERFQNVHLVNTPDIHPGHRLISRWREHIERQFLSFIAASAGIVEDCDRDLVSFFLADVDKRARGEPRLFGSFLNQLHR